MLNITPSPFFFTVTRIIFQECFFLISYHFLCLKNFFPRLQRLRVRVPPPFENRGGTHPPQYTFRDRLLETGLTTHSEDLVRVVTVPFWGSSRHGRPHYWLVQIWPSPVSWTQWTVEDTVWCSSNSFLICQQSLVTLRSWETITSCWTSRTEYILFMGCVDSTLFRVMK